MATDSADHVNYEEIAPTYNQRYVANPLPQVAATQRALVQELAPARIEAALAQAEAAGETLVFPVDILLTITIGRLAQV
jgi:hypothetical protein